MGEREYDDRIVTGGQLMFGWEDDDWVGRV